MTGVASDEARATHEPSPDGLGHSVGVANATHTPGPWLRVDTADYAEIHVARDMSSSPVALVGRVGDANLIAAAPDMLATLELVAEGHATHVEVLSAIAKARGGFENGPANPNAFPACNEANVNDTMGMTLRDWFAGQAVKGHLATDEAAELVAKCAYTVADAMLAARERAAQGTPTRSAETTGSVGEADGGPVTAGHAPETSTQTHTTKKKGE